jgi:succinate dehydrogenase / fumarate reductase flavoprotein subunit
VETLGFDNLIAQAVVTMDPAANRTSAAGSPRAKTSQPRRQELDEDTLAWL